MESMFWTQQPCRVMAASCSSLYLEERCRVLTEMRKWLQGETLAGVLDPEAWVREAGPISPKSLLPVMPGSSPWESTCQRLLQ